MGKKLEPTLAEIPEIEAEQRTMKMRCTGKGEAIWARFDLMYPIIITSRKFLGRLANGAAMDCDIMAVKVEEKMHSAIPSHVGPGTLDVILQAKGATGIEVELSCRIEPQTAGEATEAVSVADAVAALEDDAFADATASEHKERPADPVTPLPTAQRISDALQKIAQSEEPEGGTPRRIELEPVENAQLSPGGPFPANITPEVAAQATENLQSLLTAKDMDDATRKSIEAFVDNDGDPTATLHAEASKLRTEMEPA